ncbi:hypothetical protein TSUD_20610 [Trifolium subterraneum]|uniref:Uncharacterized protein n=1 Tax=Trifolium subterraneum TaxID=3900 RepID=A0A2Z6MP44_TRISU|nr:hypothetical protein TSUD_20610 [Trifolium subterraneum]
MLTEGSLKILNQLVCEINQHTVGLHATRHRRIASSFRDQSLFLIFQISLTSLFKLKADVGSKLQELSLMLSLSCLSFDFMGTSYDESSDEIGTNQIPTTWKPVLEDSSTLQIFFDYYTMNQPFSKEFICTGSVRNNNESTTRPPHVYQRRNIRNKHWSACCALLLLDDLCFPMILPD